MFVSTEFSNFGKISGKKNIKAEQYIGDGAQFFVFPMKISQNIAMEINGGKNLRKEKKIVFTIMTG